MWKYIIGALLAGIAFGVFWFMKPAEKVNTEQINRVIAKQSLKVDTVTGATVNSKALLKAIENAMKSGVSR